MTSTAHQPSMPPGALVSIARDIKLSHTLFAMPWAILATFLAARGTPSAFHVVLIVLCMITARSVAMLANRLLDARLDALNPRTRGRAIPSGRVSKSFAFALLLVMAVAFVACTSGFWFLDRNPWPVLLAIPALLFICTYPLLKRYSALCHFYLGAALAAAPVCAWIAITGHIASAPLLMAGAVLLWTAGFDIIYACQDYESDRLTGVFSVPARLGIARALWVSKIAHVGSVAMLIALGRSEDFFGPLYFSGVALVIVLLLVEHTLVRPDDLTKVGIAFFTVNGFISLILGTLGVIDIYV